MIKTEKLTEWEKQAVLSWFLAHSPQELRTALQYALPAAYNKLVGKDVMAVSVQRNDGLPNEPR